LFKGIEGVRGFYQSIAPALPDLRIDVLYSLDTVLAILNILEDRDIGAALPWLSLCCARLKYAAFVGRITTGRSYMSAFGLSSSHRRNEASARPTGKARLRLCPRWLHSAVCRAHAAGLERLNWRVIAPTLKAAGILWHGHYAGRRGISSLVTDTSKNDAELRGRQVGDLFQQSTMLEES
jgi:hypothetical protein